MVEEGGVLHTISFYSYKGGVGRSLAVANVAHYLAGFGQKVFVIDFDLEAPGLSYKFGEKNLVEQKSTIKGIVDYVLEYKAYEEFPQNLGEFVIKIPVTKSSKGSIHLMPAGNAPSTNYWKKLGQLNWHDFFYSESPQGIPFFLEFKERIEQAYKPDFLLIDSRTGITDIGGIATMLLPDQVVCFLLNNKENRDGTREVLRSIQRSERLQASIELIPVLTRIPFDLDEDKESKLTGELKNFLNEESFDLEGSLEISEVFTFHSEPLLQMEEFLFFGDNAKAESSRLFSDCIRLFVKFLPKDVVKNEIQPIINQLMNDALDDAEGTQKGLEALASTYPSAVTHVPMIKFLRLRNYPNSRILEAAENLWNRPHEAEGVFLWDIVKSCFKKQEYSSSSPYSLEFIQDVWQKFGNEDFGFGMTLAKTYETIKDKEKALEIYCLLQPKSNDPFIAPDVIIPIIRLSLDLKNIKQAEAHVNHWKAKDLGRNALFQIQWMRLLVEKKSKRAAMELYKSGDLQGLAELGEINFMITKSFLILAGYTDEVFEMAKSLLETALSEGPNELLVNIGRSYLEHSQGEHYVQAVRQKLGVEGDNFLNEYFNLPNNH